MTYKYYGKCSSVALKLGYNKDTVDFSVELTDLQAGTTVEIKGLPPDSIVIRAEDFEESS